MQGHGRIHEHAGYVHIHDDTNGLAVRVISYEFERQFREWVARPTTPLRFFDKDRRTKVVISLKEQGHWALGQALDLDVDIMVTKWTANDAEEALYAPEIMFPYRRPEESPPPEGEDVIVVVTKIGRINESFPVVGSCRRRRWTFNGITAEEAVHYVVDLWCPLPLLPAQFRSCHRL